MATKPKLSKGPTIQDVALRAGVSISAVSHVLNGNTQRVGPEKRARVLEVVRELNYRPNAIARSMVRRSTRTIGLVITSVSNALFSPVTIGVEEILRGHGYQLVLANVETSDDEMAAVEALRAQQVDGFIFMSNTINTFKAHMLQLKQEQIPFVTINRNLDDAEFHRVHFDDVGAGRIATQHLLSQGHTRFGTLAGPLDAKPVWQSAHDRHRGWQQALEQHQIAIEPDWVIRSPYDFEGGYQATKQLLATIQTAYDRPSALFIANDAMAIGALKALYEAGLRVPQDIAVVCVGDPPYAAYTIPALTTVTLPVIEAGRVAARLLMDCLADTPPGYAQGITLLGDLKIRESCGAALRT